MKRVITSIAAAVSLALLSLAVPVAASAQTTQTRTSHTHNTSDSQSPYVAYCLSAIDDAIRDADIDAILDKVLHLPMAAKAYDISATGSDEAELKYELSNGHFGDALFTASVVFYDVLGLIPGKSPFWAVGPPATRCLEAAVVWDLQTGAKVGAQIRKDLEKFLSGLTPTGLTVRPDSSNGTVLLLTWHAHKMSPLTSFLTSFLKPGFEVNDGARNRSAPAGSGQVNYTWTGLQPGSRACFKVRATYALGDSAWDPNAAPWHVCAYSSSPSPPPGPCTPKIDAVGAFEATATQTVEITGSCFGTGNTSSAADTAYFRISDLTAGWNACWTGDPGTDQVTCNVSSWTNQKIIFSGFTGDYGQNGWGITAGDHIEIQVWNPQSGKGPTTYEVVAAGGPPTCCDG
jgi:hypothetical protein